MTQTIKKTVNKALLHHQAVGNKIAFWDNGKIVVEVPTNIKVKKIGENINKSKLLANKTLHRKPILPGS